MSHEPTPTKQLTAAQLAMIGRLPRCLFSHDLGVSHALSVAHDLQKMALAIGGETLSAHTPSPETK